MGNLPEISRDWLGTLTRYAREYGDFVPLRLGPKRAVLVSHPSYVEDVLVRHHRSFIKSLALRHSRRIFGDGLVTSEGAAWLSQRRLVQPAMHHQQIATYARTMLEATNEMLSGWRDGDELDLYAELSRLTLQIVTRTLFGTSIDARDATDVSRAINVALEGFDRRVKSLLFLVPDTVPLPGHLEYLRQARRLDEIVYRLIERARDDGATGDSILSMLLRCRVGDGRRLTDRQIRDQMVSLIIAGHETTALTLSWAFVLLAQHPQIEARLHDHVDRLTGGIFAEVQMDKLHYADWIVAETLRVFPTSWVIARESIAGCAIGPFGIDPGVVVIISQWIVHHDSRLYADPDCFHPERWAGGLAQQLPRFGYMPYGGGPRVCIGNAFARMEMVLLLAAISRQFQLLLLPGQAIVPRPSATLGFRTHPWVRVRERKPTEFNGAPAAPVPAGPQVSSS
jgi:cytochrome P450